LTWPFLLPRAATSNGGGWSGSKNYEQALADTQESLPTALLLNLLAAELPR